MRDLEITSGKWHIINKAKVKNGEEYPAIDSDNATVIIWDTSTPIDLSPDENLANAELIVDAGNTYQKTGMLPSELAKQNAELLEALKYAKRLLRHISEKDYDLEYLETTIQKAEGGKQ